MFTYRKDWEAPVYERTFPADAIYKAFQWLKVSGYTGFLSVECLPTRSYY